MNRLAFGIIEGAAGQVRAPEAKVLLFHVDTTTDRPRASGLATFVPWPHGRQGVFVANVELDAPGQWGIVAEIVGADGAVRQAQSGVFQVKPETSSPGIGHAAPASVTRTSADVADLAELTTSPDPRPGPLPHDGRRRRIQRKAECDHLRDAGLLPHRYVRPAGRDRLRAEGQNRPPAPTLCT